jgi:hypothetical protein
MSSFSSDQTTLNLAVIGTILYLEQVELELLLFKDME